MPAGSIVIDLLMKTGAFETDTKRAEKRLNELKKEAQKVGVAIGGAFAAVGVAAAAMVKSSIDAMDEMSKMAQKVGTSVEALSALGYAADLSGVSNEALGSAMVKLSKNMSDAAMGTGEAEKGFKALGISVKNADGTLKSTDQMLAEVADKFAGFKDGAEKTALAVAIFGKAGAELIPLLNGGSAGLSEMRDEAQRLGVVLDTDAAKAAEAFNDDLSRMAAAVTGVANRAAADLLPALNDVSSMFVELAKNEAAVDTATGIVKTSVSALITVFQTVAVLGSDIGFVFQSIGREIGALAAQAAALGVGFKDMMGGPAAIAAAMAKAAISGDLSFQRFSAISEAVKKDGERARAELDKFQARVMTLGTAGSAGLDDEARRRLGHGVPTPLRAAPGIQEKAPKGKDPDADFKAYLRNLEQQVQKTQELTSAEKVLDDVRRGALSVTEPQKKQLLALAAQIDADKERTEQIKLRREAVIAEGDAVNKANEEYQDLIQRLLDGGPAAQLEKQRKTMLLLTEALEKGSITAAQYNDAATGYLGLQQKQVEETKSMTEELGLTFASAFEEAVLGGGNLSDVFKGLLQDIARVILRMGVIEPMMKRLKESMQGLDAGGASDFSGFLAALFSGLAGGVAPSLAGAGGGAGNYNFGGGFADGGSPPVGKVSLVGERGPEWFVPRTAGTIVPNHMLAGGKNEKLTIVNQTTGRIDRAEQRRLSPSERVLIIQEARTALAGDWADPNSLLSRNFRRYNGGTTRVR